MRSCKRLGVGIIAVLSFLAVSAATREARADKVGPWMFNLKLGPAIGLSGAGTQFALVLDANYGVAFNKNLYIGFPLQFGFGGGATFIGAFPIQVQYDFAIPQVRGLYAYPRFTVGYGLITGGGTAHGALIDIGGGVKYVLNGRWNFGFEPIDIPILAGQVVGVQYRLLFYAGINL